MYLLIGYPQYFYCSFVELKPLEIMQTTISVLKKNVSKAVEELTNFANVRFELKRNSEFTEITVTSNFETDILNVREIEKKHNGHTES